MNNMDDNTILATPVELMRLRHSVISMRKTIVASLNNLEDQINVLLPQSVPATPVKYDLDTLRSIAGLPKTKKRDKKGKTRKKGKALNK